MPRCPVCGSEIHYLYNFSEEWRKYKVWLNGDNLEYEEINEVYVIEEEYVCPECGAVIATTEEDAKKFLKSK
jgi:hypothetical protein